MFGIVFVLFFIVLGILTVVNPWVRESLKRSFYGIAALRFAILGTLPVAIFWLVIFVVGFVFFLLGCAVLDAGALYQQAGVVLMQLVVLSFMFPRLCRTSGALYNWAVSVVRQIEAHSLKNNYQ